MKATQGGEHGRPGAGRRPAGRVWTSLRDSRRDSADGCLDMAHLDVPGTLGDAECTMRRGRLGRRRREEMGAKEGRWASAAAPAEMNRRFAFKEM